MRETEWKRMIIKERISYSSQVMSSDVRPWAWDSIRTVRRKEGQPGRRLVWGALN